MDSTVGKEKPKHKEWVVRIRTKNSPRPGQDIQQADEVETRKIILETILWSSLLLNKLGQRMSLFV